MSHVLNYRGKYFRIEIAEVAKFGDSESKTYVGWSSDAFGDLKEMPKQACTRFVSVPPQPTFAEALELTFDWVKSKWDDQLSKQIPLGGIGKRRSVVYTVWLFKGDVSSELEFEEFADAKVFAQAAEKSHAITKIGITNNESPQYLTLWERTTQG